MIFVVVAVGALLTVGFVVAARTAVPRAKIQAERQAEYEGTKLSDVGQRTAAGLACPSCGSTSFEAKRSAGGKLAAGMLAPKTRVKCVACGVEFIRG